MESERPVDLTERRIANINRRIAVLLGEVGELQLEKSRLESGQQPRDILPKDRFWRQTINFDQGYREQANQQSDAKEMQVQPPYNSLLQ